MPIPPGAATHISARYAAVRAVMMMADLSEYMVVPHRRTVRDLPYLPAIRFPAELSTLT